MNSNRTASQFASDALVTGAVATAATTVSVAAFGQGEESEPIAPINAISHIAWGDEAARHSDPSLKYTLPGLLLNTAAITSWAVVHEALFGSPPIQRSLAKSLAGGAAVSAMAYVTDYHIVPKRFTPGFEKRLSNRSLAATYGVLALGLGIGSWLRRS
jgi:hypothetical protein